MLIDWFTVGAQVLNFLILVWLLKRFLYKPILNAIDAREKQIATELANAEAKKADAQKEHDEFEKKNQVFDDERGSMLAKAKQDAQAEHDRLINEAKKDADSVRVEQATVLKNDQTRLSSEITQLGKREVFAIARKTLGDLATVSLEERMGEVFTRRLQEMQGKSKDDMGAAIRAVNETFSVNAQLLFETSGDAVCGIELSSNGQKVGWNITEYLAALGEKVGALLEAQGPTLTKAEPQLAPTGAQ